MKKKEESFEFRDNIKEILKKVDKFRPDYDTATMLALIEGFILGFSKGINEPK